MTHVLKEKPKMSVLFFKSLYFAHQKMTTYIFENSIPIKIKAILEWELIILSPVDS